MADYKMKAREYKKGFMYWISIHKEVNEKNQRLVRPALFLENRLIDGVWHYAWMFFGVNSYMTFREDEFDTDGQIEVYKGTKWQNNPNLTIKKNKKNIPNNGSEKVK
jgi:hypothetical protein